MGNCDGAGDRYISTASFCSALRLRIATALRPIKPGSKAGIGMGVAGTEMNVIDEAEGSWIASLKLLRHILINLLSNAVKYSRDQNNIAFAVSCHSDGVIFRIQDQGIGIPVKDQLWLFSSFHRGSNARNILGRE